MVDSDIGAGASDELFPFIVYRVAGEQIECAMWRLDDGQPALAIFLTQESAEAYRGTAGLDDRWVVFQPDREALSRLLRTTVQAGVNYAVLDPTAEDAKRLFDLRQVLENL